MADSVNEDRLGPGSGALPGAGWRAGSLAMVAGDTDAYGFRHYEAYVSFMSGNTTQTGLNLGQAA